jgi:hypothetical protein
MDRTTGGEPESVDAHAGSGEVSAHSGGMHGDIGGGRAAETSLEGMISLPGEDATAEERAEFYKEISGTWTPADGYRFAMPDGLPESFPYDQDFAREAGDWFREAGLHPSAAQALHDRWVGKMAELHQHEVRTANERAQEQAEAVDHAHRELVREYGAPGSDGYRNAVAKADRAMNGLKAEGIDVTGWFAEKGILSDADAHGLQQVADPVAVRLLAFLHDKAFREDGLTTEGSGNARGNPFDLKTTDIGRQTEIIRSTPERAKALIIAAGRDPKKFNL